MESRKLICKNDLIDSTKKYNPIQLRIFYNMLYCYKEQELYKKDLVEDENVVHMELSALENYLGKKHFVEKELIDIIQGIPKGIYSKDSFSYISVFDFIKYDSEYYEFVFKLNDGFKPFVDEIINNFTVLELKGLSELNSSYSQRMFEFVSKNKNIKDYTMKIDDFKKYFEIPDSYAMSDIDRRILKKCSEDINKKTNFNLRIEKIKKRNKVTHIIFHIR